VDLIHLVQNKDKWRNVAKSTTNVPLNLLAYFKKQSPS
jgi:hypothetical protein